MGGTSSDAAEVHSEGMGDFKLKRALQISMVVVGAIPLVLGVVNFVIGAERIVPADQVTPSLDNMWRFYSVWFTVVFFLTIWCARNLEIAGPVMRIVFLVMAAGGLARVYSIFDVGVPDAPPMIAAIFVEIGVLGFIPWHAVVMKRQGAMQSA